MKASVESNCLRANTQNFSTLAALSLVLSAAATMNVHADVLVSGSATIDYHRDSWASVAGGSPLPGFEALTLNEVFDRAGAESRTANQLLTDEVVASPGYSGLVYEMNGSTVNNLAGRTAQPTTFSFDPASLTSNQGVIGLGGVTRWDVNPLLGGGGLLFGDFTVGYDASRSLVGGSGWFVKANIAPAAVVFDLAKVNATWSNNQFELSGDLALSPEVATFLFSTPANAGMDMGDFRFIGITAVPEPSLMGLGCLAGLIGMVRLRCSRKRHAA